MFKFMLTEGARNAMIIIVQLQEGWMFLSFLKRIFQKIGNFFLSLNDVDKMT